MGTLTDAVSGPDTYRDEMSGPEDYSQEEICTDTYRLVASGSDA